MYNELDEQNEVLFFEQGMYEIGYEINRVKKYVLKYRNTKNSANVIAAYGATFNKRSSFIIKTCTECSGFFIRKQNWQRIMKDNS